MLRKTILIYSKRMKFIFLPFASFVSLKSLPSASIADSLIRIDSSSSPFASSLTIRKEENYKSLFN